MMMNMAKEFFLITPAQCVEGTLVDLLTVKATSFTHWKHNQAVYDHLTEERALRGRRSFGLNCVNYLDCLLPCANGIILKNSDIYDEY